jgi:hypothetical protein
MIFDQEEPRLAFTFGYPHVLQADVISSAISLVLVSMSLISKSIRLGNTNNRECFRRHRTSRWPVGLHD